MKDFTKIYRSIDISSPHFSGILSNYPVPINTVININDVDFSVVRCIKIDFKMFYRSGLLYVGYQGNFMRNQVQVKQFLQSVGFNSVNHFLFAMYRNPVVMDSCGVIDCYYISFDHKYFR